jgi:hypothetical protein
MRYFKLNHKSSGNEIMWYISDDAGINVKWVDTGGVIRESNTSHADTLIYQYDYIEVLEEEFNKYMLVWKLIK